MTEITGKQAGPIGLGLMGLTWRATPPPQEQAFDTLRAALDNGCNCWNGADFYGTPDYNSLVLVERYFEKYPEDADKVILSIKGGVNPDTHQVDGSPENTRRCLDNYIAQLKGRKRIDIFEFGRRDPNVPLEVTFKVIEEEYVKTGKIGGIGLSEVRAETIHEAVKWTKIVVVEAELSMFTLDILENGVADACTQYGIPIVAYSPMGRGLLTGQMKKFEDLPKDSLLLQFNFPRFQAENFDQNVQLVHKVEEIAQQKGCTPAQLAVNWVRALGRRSKATIIPIPGASTVARVEENSQLFEITDEEMAQIDGILEGFTAAGERYPPIFHTNT
ncbi:NADP-dependent oxidoreductase domain-containing protein [Aspergillus cavernicola]|uniref:NADP-dependent oxidoreductase domain-containing protein n=1 Tax=Aspergillus cavernicola TaxID=176166 RepID=A0ABR4IBG4_9EURO